MPFDPSGFFLRLFRFANDRDNGIKILADRMDQEFDNVKTAIDDITGDNFVHRGSITAAQGTDLVPSFTFNNDTDTGLYRPAPDEIGVVVGGFETARFQASTAPISGNKVLTAADTGAGQGLDADTLDGQQGAFYQNASNLNAGTIDNARLPVSISSDITGNAATATDADTLDGQHGAFYQNATNLIAGTIDNARLPLTISSDISGNAATATLATNATNAANADNATNAATATLASDAQLLDGLNSSQFIRSDANDDVTGLLDIKRTVDQQLRLGFEVNTQPAVNFYNNLTIRGAIQARTEGMRLFNHVAGTDLTLLDTGVLEYNGSRVLTQADEGAGKGLDADTLDGLQASQFLRSDINDISTGRIDVRYPVSTQQMSIGFGLDQSNFIRFYRGTTGAFALQVNADHVFFNNEMTTNDLRLYNDGRVEYGGQPLAGVYDGSSSTNTNFPIGTVVWLITGSTTRNATVAVRLDPSSSHFTVAGSGTLLAGTWRARGGGASGHLLAQRTA